MSAYRRWKFIPLIFAIAYPSIAGSVLVSRWHDAIQEIYPVAPWTLFCFTPNRETDFQVRLRAIDGQPLDPPRYLDDLVKLSEEQKLLAYFTAQELGQLIEADDRRAFSARQSNYEQTFLKLAGKDVRYELVRRKFDVLNRWRTGQCDTIEVIGTFESGSESKPQ